jgi:hypothetical protein
LIWNTEKNKKSERIWFQKFLSEPAWKELEHISKWKCIVYTQAAGNFYVAPVYRDT